MSFRAYIAGESETVTDSPSVARLAYAELLGRDDLIGADARAVLERDGQPLYESSFAAPVGSGRIHPEAPLDVYAAVADASRVAAWRPAVWLGAGR